MLGLKKCIFISLIWLFALDSNAQAVKVKVNAQKDQQKYWGILKVSNADTSFYSNFKHNKTFTLYHLPRGFYTFRLYSIFSEFEENRLQIDKNRNKIKFKPSTVYKTCLDTTSLLADMKTNDTLDFYAVEEGVDWPANIRFNQLYKTDSCYMIRYDENGTSVTICLNKKAEQVLIHADKNRIEKHPFPNHGMLYSRWNCKLALGNCVHENVRLPSTFFEFLIPDSIGLRRDSLSFTSIQSATYFDYLDHHADLFGIRCGYIGVETDGYRAISYLKTYDPDKIEKLLNSKTNAGKMFAIVTLLEKNAEDPTLLGKGIINKIRLLIKSDFKFGMCSGCIHYPTSSLQYFKHRKKLLIKNGVKL